MKSGKKLEKVGKGGKNGEKWIKVVKSGEKLEKVGKGGKNGEKWIKVGKSGLKWGKVGKSGEKLGKVGKGGEKCGKWGKVTKSGEKLEKVGKSSKSGEKWGRWENVLFKKFGQNGRRRPFWMSENNFRSQFLPFQIDTQLFFFEIFGLDDNVSYRTRPRYLDE